MPAYLLTNRQVRTALDMAGIEVGPASPLASLPPVEQPLSPGDAAFDKLAEGHLLEPQDSAWRVNILAKAVLLACARPEEVISLVPAGGDSTGFSVCRRGPLLSECTVGAPGLVKLAFPLSRSAVILMLTSALSSERPEEPPTGFLFRGRAEDAFVLSVVLAEARGRAGGPPATSTADLVASAVQDPNRTLPFVLVVGAEPLLGLARSRDGIEAALGRLAVAGHVRHEGGRIVPSEAARQALEAPPVAGFGLSRVLVGPDGPAAQGLQVMRCGERNIVFRLLRHGGEQPLFEWSEATRQQLRSLVGAVLMEEKELEAALSTPAPAPRSGPAEAVFCPNCGRETRPGQRFCRFCGRNLVEDAP